MRCIHRDQGRELLQEIHAAHVVTMSDRKHLSGKLSDKVSTGPRRSPTRMPLCDAVKGANFTLGKLTSRHKRCTQSPSRGPL
jgi:hypothetical protein